MSLISVQAISKSYFDKVVLDNISLNIHSGDRIGLIGENGAGKTTLFKIITDKETLDSGKVVVSSGTILGYLSQSEDLSGADQIDALSNRELEDLQKKIRIQQNKIANFDGDHDGGKYKTIISTYEKLMSRFEALDGYSYERNLKEILNGLGLPENALTLPFSALSGGEKMRVNFAKILLLKPDVLLLDEPTNHLDIDAIMWLEDTLSKFKGGLVVISHDRYFLDKVTNKTSSLEDGQIYLSNGNYSSYILQKQEQIEYALKEKKRLENELIKQIQIKQTMLSHRNMSGYHEREKMVARLEDALSSAKKTLRHQQKSNLKLSFTTKDNRLVFDKLLISAKNLKKQFSDRVLFENVNFEVFVDDKIFLVGPNGCGKSTLFSLFLGEISDFDGEIKIKKGMRYIHMTQHISFDNEDISVLDYCSQKFYITEGKVRELLSGYGFFDTDIHKKISILSGGEKSRLFLALALKEKPDILLLDEPTNHLDIPSREVLEKALNDYDGAFIAISHDRYFIKKCQRKILGFLNSKIKEFENYDSYQKGVANENETDNVNLAKKEKPDEKDTKNKALLRQKKAKLNTDIKNIEIKIKGLEEKSKELEKSFNQDTLPEEYEQYANILEELDTLFEKYVKMTDKDI